MHPFLLVLAGLSTLLIPPLAYSGSRAPYAGNLGYTNPSTANGFAKKDGVVTPTGTPSQTSIQGGKPAPIENPFKGTAENNKGIQK